MIYLLFGLNKMCQYPREAWRPILEGNCPAFERGWEHPARVLGRVEGLHLHPHRHNVSNEWF